jgi:glycosyltransferase involved in cell wall biosynthesis
MRLAIVTTHPPGTGSLNEYGFHLSRHLAAKDEVEEVVLLVDELPEGHGYASREGISVIECWRFGSLLNPLRILRAIRSTRPDAVIFNLQFASFGDGRLAAALGLTAPLLARVGGVTSIVLLHNLMDTVDLRSAGFEMHPLTERIVRMAGRVMTRILLRADLVAVTMPTYVTLLRSRYGATNVALAPHGTFEDIPDLPAQPSGRRRIMTFGKFGTYKRVEVLVAAFRALHAQDPRTELVIAGTDSPNASGYLDAVRRANSDLRGLTFTGYVPEEDVADLFRSADVVVFPYTSTTGSSGVLHQAGEHGRAVVLPDIGDLGEVVREEGYAAATFEPDDADDLARAIRGLLDDEAARLQMGRQNLAAARGLPLSDVTDWYLFHIDALQTERKRPQRRTPAWT